MSGGLPAVGSGAEARLLAASARYERALGADDLAALDELFAPGWATLRGDGGAALVGHATISAFRARRGGAPQRWLRRVHLRWLSATAAVTTTESERRDGGTGVQTQVWEDGPDGWRVTTAHVSTAPAAAAPAAAAPAAPAPDGGDAVWRVPPSGTPLLAGADEGPLARLRVAVKDNIGVAGQRIGAGVPAWLGTALVEPLSAPALDLLLEAGADVVGIARTDELAFSLMGTNAHHGTPPNPRAPGRVPGGSTSGPAVAVASGAADVGLGTDTAGSLRVPASFCGLHALRPTHDRVPVVGALELARSFDTVGLLTRDAGTLAAAADVLLPLGADTRPGALLWPAELAAAAGEGTALAALAAVRALAVQTGLPLRVVDLPLGRVDAWVAAFRTVQAAEAWRAHRGFVEANPGALSGPVEARFRAGERVEAEEEGAARRVLVACRSFLDGLLRDRGEGPSLLALPSTAGPAPSVDAPPAELEAARAGALRCTVPASAAGLPVLALPWPRVGELPTGLSLVGPVDGDRSLLALLREVGPPLRPGVGPGVGPGAGPGAPAPGTGPAARS